MPVKTKPVREKTKGAHKQELRGGGRRAPVEELFSEMPPGIEWTQITMMLFGSPGCGKTWLASSAAQVPEMQPVLLLDNDGGSRSIRGKDQFSDVTIWRINVFEAYNQIYARIVEDPTKYKTIIVDNLGALYNKIMEMEMEEVCKGDPSREPEVPSQREYMICRGIMRKLVTFFSELGELGINIIFTSHVEMDKNELDKIKKIRPALAGKLAYEIPGDMPIVGYMTTEVSRGGTRSFGADKGKEVIPETTRKVLFQPQNTIDAKDQSDTLGYEMIDPTMLKIASAIGIVNRKQIKA